MGSCRRVAAVAIAVVGGFLLLLAWDLYSIRSELSAGQAALDDLTLDAAGSQGLTGLADDAASHLDAADGRARSSLPLRLLSILPGSGDQVRGLRDLTRVTDELGETGAAAAQAIDARLAEAGEPAGRVALLDEAIAQLQLLAGSLDDLDLRGAGGLAGPLGRAHDDLESTIQRARGKVAEAQDLIVPLRDMLQGPSSYFLLAANNAEMAGGAGLTLSAGLLTFDGGDIELGDVVAASGLRLPDSVELPGELLEVYRPTGIGIDFRSTTRSPNLPAMGPVVEAMLAPYLRLYPDIGQLDGVIVVDAVALRDVMELTGPVEVDGKSIDADSVLADVLNENYKLFETAEDKPERVSYQGDIASAVFESLTERDVPAAKLAEVMLTSSKGRHVMLWSKDPKVQAMWEELLVAGELPPNGLMICFQNYAANKLDWYLRPEATLDVSLLPSGDYRARLTMTMDVPGRSDLPDASAYILGPTPETQGTFLTVHLPGTAYDITTTDPRGFRTNGQDGPLQVRTFLVNVPLGTTLTRTVDFSLPRTTAALLLLPSARVEPLTLRVDDTATVTDEVTTAISWLAAGPPHRPSDAGPLPAMLLVRSSLLLVDAAAIGLAVWVWRERRGNPATQGPLLLASVGASLGLVGLALAGIVALMLATPRV